LIDNYITTHQELQSFEQVAKHFGVYHYREDDTKLDKRFNEFVTQDFSDKLNEVRISLTKSIQLKGLYKLMNLMKLYCSVPPFGGIHIHIDFTDYWSDQNIQLCSKFIYNHLHEVENIFPPYVGSYNKRDVGIRKKGTYVNFSNYKSIEYRIAPLTFDYNTLLTWIVMCNKFTSSMIQRCHLNKVGKVDSKPKIYQSGGSYISCTPDFESPVVNNRSTGWTDYRNQLNSNSLYQYSMNYSSNVYGAYDIENYYI
jgi:hypothetical protein